MVTVPCSPGKRSSGHSFSNVFVVNREAVPNFYLKLKNLQRKHYQTHALPPTLGFKFSPNPLVSCIEVMAPKLHRKVVFLWQAQIRKK